MIKRLTGGTTVKARRVFAPVYIERVPAFTPWMVTNNFPTIEGADQALYRRLVAVPFSSAVSKDEEVGTFAARLRALALPAVLAWAVRGWEMYVREGLADVPLAAAEAALLMRGELSDLDVFLSEACEFGGSYRVLSADLYKAYVVWCEQGRIKPESSTKFGRHMTNRGHARGLSRVGDRDEDQKARVRLGLRLNAGWATVVGGES
jgi:putative DNA primase/helicase